MRTISLFLVPLLCVAAAAEDAPRKRGPGNEGSRYITQSGETGSVYRFDSEARPIDPNAKEPAPAGPAKKPEKRVKSDKKPGKRRPGGAPSSPPPAAAREEAPKPEAKDSQPPAGGETAPEIPPRGPGAEPDSHEHGGPDSHDHGAPEDVKGGPASGGVESPVE